MACGRAFTILLLIVGLVAQSIAFNLIDAIKDQFTSATPESERLEREEEKVQQQQRNVSYELQLYEWENEQGVTFRNQHCDNLSGCDTSFRVDFDLNPTLNASHHWPGPRRTATWPLVGAGHHSKNNLYEIGSLVVNGSIDEFLVPVARVHIRDEDDFDYDTIDAFICKLPSTFHLDVDAYEPARAHWSAPEQCRSVTEELEPFNSRQPNAEAIAGHRLRVRVRAWLHYSAEEQAERFVEV